MNDSQPLWSAALTKEGIALQTEAASLLAPSAQWLELATTGGESVPLHWADAGENQATASGGGWTIHAKLHEDPGADARLARVDLVCSHEMAEAQPMNLKWTLPFSDQETTPRWLVPALIYKDAEQQYDGGHPSLVGDDLKLLQNPWWVFRADLTAVPLTMAWVKDGSIGLLMEEEQNGLMGSVGLDHRQGTRAVIGAWPYREEPRRRETTSRVSDPMQPVVTYATVKPKGKIHLSFWLVAGSSDPYAFAPVLRETFSRWDDRYPEAGHYCAKEGADAAAYGLMHWHYDPETRMLWEAGDWSPGLDKGESGVTRFEMHTGFTSGTPYAQPLRKYGLLTGRKDWEEAGKNVIDVICENMTPFGTFWSLFHQERGWDVGWPSPQRSKANPGADRDVGDLQARTISEATFFTLQAVQDTPEAPEAALWRKAGLSNLDFILRTQREDGNVGQAYGPKDGEVWDWDGEEGIFWIAALVLGYRISGEARYLEAAKKAGAYYQPAVEDAYLTGAPEAMHLLPTSEDPQYAVISYTMLFEDTQDQRWLTLAQKCADYFMTFRWQYNTSFDPDSIMARYGFCTKGLDISSPNNVHLHPFGVVAAPWLVRLWELTGDVYLLKQTRNNILSCAQMMCWRDGIYNGLTGMSTERWMQTPNGIQKGMYMPLTHSWTTGVLLQVFVWMEEHGHLFFDATSNELISFDALTVERRGDAWSVKNPWDRDLTLKLVVRHGAVAVEIDGERRCLAEDGAPMSLALSAKGETLVKLCR